MKARSMFAIALMVMSVTIAAHGQNAALRGAYDKWKAETIKQRGGTPEHYALTVYSKRNNPQEASVNFLVAGKIPVLNVAICPLTFDRAADGTMINIRRGEEVMGKQDLDFASSRAGSELDTAIPIDNTNNAVEVKWSFDAEGKHFEYTMILPLEDAASTNVLGIVPSGGNNINLKPNCPYDCYEVSGSNVRCGYFYACCRTLIGNTINYITCSVHCSNAC